MHTPGSWNLVGDPKFDEDAECFTQRIFAGNGGICEILGQDEENQCWLEVDAGNARLIAAAPELLEACKFALPLLKYHVSEDSLNILATAIAKAEGRA